MRQVNYGGRDVYCPLVVTQLLFDYLALPPFLPQPAPCSYPDKTTPLLNDLLISWNRVSTFFKDHHLFVSTPETKETFATKSHLMKPGKLDVDVVKAGSQR